MTIATPLDKPEEPEEIIAAPVRPDRRIASLDVLRGFALLGILVLNIEDFSGPEALHDIPVGLAKPAFVGWHAHLDLVILTVKWLFFEGKMRALFATLFGAGCVLLTERIERRKPESSADIFLRRSLWLTLFGVAHGVFIWGGDILIYYGLNALLFLYPLRHVAARKLMLAGLAISLAGSTLGIYNFSYHPAISHQSGLTAEGMDQDRAEITKAVAQTTAQTYEEETKSRVKGYFGFFLALMRSGWILEVTGMLMFGMGLYKTGFLSAAKSPKFYAATAFLGYAVSTPMVLLGVHQAYRAGFSDAASAEWMYLPYGLEQIPAMLANSSVILLLVRLGWFKPLQRALASVGRTAFTNYIGTSLLCQFIFVWGPWRLYGDLEYYQQIYFVAGVWAVNIAASTLWLRYFPQGPLEWGWRSLTYWQRQPFRIARA